MAVKNSSLIALKIEIKLDRQLESGWISQTSDEGKYWQLFSKFMVVKKAKSFGAAKHHLWGMGDHKKLSILIK